MQELSAPQSRSHMRSSISKNDGKEQIHQAQRMIGGIGNVLFYRPILKLENGKSKSFFGEPLKHVITIRGQILVSRTDDDLLLPVCPFKTSLCVRSKRPRVYRHHAYTYTYTNQTHTTTTNNTTTTTTTKHTTQNTQHHTETETERDRARDGETRQEDKRR